ncbi:serum paraoxonase/arylesterase 2-like [Pholidichthys leucotaenia]
MKKVLLATVVAAFAAFIGHRFLQLKEMTLASRELSVKHLNCQYLQNIEFGAEDITILNKDGRAFLSAGLKFPGLPSFSDEPGKMYVLDLLHPKPTPELLNIKGELDLSSFNPHGISVYVDEADDSVYVFVVNHPQHETQVELFKFVEEDLSLVHLKTIKHELLYSVNDIVAVGMDSFYATNDHYFSNKLLKSYVEPFLAQPWTNVVYFSPTEVKMVSEGYYMANGINMSPDKRYVYVVDPLGHDVHMLERKEDNALTTVKSVGVGSLCDNVEVDLETGDLWLGCHPNGKILMFDPKDPPGSEVIRIQNIQSDQPVLTQVYADNGSVLIGSSVAATYEGKLLIGSVFHKALCCDLK